MAELADAADSKSAGLRVLGVRLPLPAPFILVAALQTADKLRVNQHSAAPGAAGSARKSASPLISLRSKPPISFV